MNFLLTGSVAYDYLMKFPGKSGEQLLPGCLDSISLSFLVESWPRRATNERRGVTAWPR
jgi:adenosine kinase